MVVEDGCARVELDGTSIDLQRRKALALLIYLAVSGQPHSRDALATLFWPDLDQSALDFDRGAENLPV